MHDAGIRVSIFLDPDGDQVRGPKAVGAERSRSTRAVTRDASAGSIGRRAGAHRRGGPRSRRGTASRCSPGHGLELHERDRDCRHLPEIVELNIGHSIVARAALVGMDRAVRDMVTLL